MITFLPNMNYLESANILDWKYKMNRLKNQVHEGININRVLIKRDETEINKHPIYIMWMNFELSLLEYTQAHLSTWEKKKKIVEHELRAILVEQQLEILNRFPSTYYRTETGKYMTNHPWWLGLPELHSSHRAILLGKSYTWYKQFNWKEEPAKRDSDARWPYYWPIIVNKEEE